MNSMTGFGSADFISHTGLNIRIEVHSYNKKQLDVRVQLPQGFARFESALKKIVSNAVERGTVFAKVEITAAGAAVDSTFRINSDLAFAYQREADKLKTGLDISGDIDVNNILNLPGVVVEEVPDSLLLEEDLAKVADSAMADLLEMRAIEGATLKNDISARLKVIAAIVESIEPLAESIPEAQKKRLLENLKVAGLDVSSDDDRVLKEIVIFSDRHDASEELTRLKSHISQFESMLDAVKPVGRSMEFLTQELQREINTLGSKAAHCEVTPLVVEFKTELEKIREQVQNVE